MSHTKPRQQSVSSTQTPNSDTQVGGAVVVVAGSIVVVVVVVVVVIVVVVVVVLGIVVDEDVVPESPSIIQLIS